LNYQWVSSYRWVKSTLVVVKVSNTAHIIFDDFILECEYIHRYFLSPLSPNWPPSLPYRGKTPWFSSRSEVLSPTSRFLWALSPAAALQFCSALWPASALQAAT
jgi:hypothetical protein